MRLIDRAAAAVGASLKLKLVLVIVALLALTIGIAPWNAIRTQRRQLLEASAERLTDLQEKLHGVLTSYMLLGEPRAVQAMLAAAGVHRGVEELRILDPEGEIRFSSQADEIGRRLDPAELAGYYGRPDPVLLQRGSSAIHSLARPIFNGEGCSPCHGTEKKVLGVLQVSLSLDRTWEQIADLRRSAIVATLLTLAVVVVGIWMALAVLVDQPLQRLVAAMGRVTEGDLGARAETGKRDEIGRLGEHLNDMIAKLERAQSELQAYHEEQLAQAERLATLGQMAAAIAHEIRNPLTGISGAMSVLARGFAEDDPRRDVIRQSRPLIDRLNKAVEDILLYARPATPQFQEVRLDDLVQRACLLAEGEASKAGIRIVHERAGDGPGGAAGPTVTADPLQLQSVVVNLLVNAAQASAAGGEVRVRTTTAEGDGGPPQAIIEVEDHGKGMTAEEAAKAFRPFFTTKAQGTGLGLAIVKVLVGQHDGTISLSSTPGEGTCVRVRLPLERRPSGEEP